MVDNLNGVKGTVVLTDGMGPDTGDDVENGEFDVSEDHLENALSEAAQKFNLTPTEVEVIRSKYTEQTDEDD